MREVLPNIFVGNSLDALSKRELQDVGVELIICAARDHPCEFRDSLDYLEFPLLDDETDNVLLYIDSAYQHIKQVKGKVLIHCVQGVSRSVAIITGFLMKRDRLTFDEAYEIIVHAYPEARIADNFAQQLRDYASIYLWDMGLNSQPHRLFRMKNAISGDKQCDVTSVKSRFLCRKCRFSLFLDVHVIPDSGENHRIECMDWMKQQVDGSLKGPLCCPGCSAKLGEFNWMGLMGEYNDPAFMITRSKVDEMPLTTSFKGEEFPKTRY